MKNNDLHIPVSASFCGAVRIGSRPLPLVTVYAVFLKFDRGEAAYTKRMINEAEKGLTFLPNLIIVDARGEISRKCDLK